MLFRSVLIDDGFPVIDTPLEGLEEVGRVWALGHYLRPGPAPRRGRSARTQ